MLLYTACFVPVSSCLVSLFVSKEFVVVRLVITWPETTSIGPSMGGTLENRSHAYCWSCYRCISLIYLHVGLEIC
jgi:hypothetical protein